VPGFVVAALAPYLARYRGRAFLAFISLTIAAITTLWCRSRFAACRLRPEPRRHRHDQQYFGVMGALWRCWRCQCGGGFYLVMTIGERIVAKPGTAGRRRLQLRLDDGFGFHQGVAGLRRLASSVVSCFAALIRSTGFSRSFWLEHDLFGNRYPLFRIMLPQIGPPAALANPVDSLRWAQPRLFWPPPCVIDPPKSAFPSNLRRAPARRRISHESRIHPELSYDYGRYD